MIFNPNERNAEIIFKADIVWNYKNIFIIIPKNKKYKLELFYTKNNTIYFSILSEEKIEIAFHKNIFLLKEGNLNLFGVDTTNKMITIIDSNMNNSWNIIKSSDFKQVK